MEMTYAELSPTQQRVLRSVAGAVNGRRQIAGHGMVGFLSAAKALVRKGLLNSWESGIFWITDQGKAVLTPEPVAPARASAANEQEQRP
jgi:hypothetical protein